MTERHVYSRTRLYAEERLDAPQHDPAALDVTLDHLVNVNRWLGGNRVVLAHLGRILNGQGPYDVLDVGTGGADIPRAIRRWALRRRKTIRLCGVDRHPQIASAARARSPDDDVEISVGDGLALPFSDGAFDVALSSMTLHHLDDSPAVAFMTELGRVARRAVIVNDLERHRVNYLGARILSATVWREDPLTRHDGPISVLRSFRRSELLGLGRAAGLRDVRVFRHFPFRLVLVGRTGPVSA